MNNSLKTYYEEHNRLPTVSSRKVHLIGLIQQFLRPKDRILDIGCGDCFILYCLASMCDAAIGLDRVVPKSVNKRVALFDYDIVEDDFSFGNIDIILLLDVLEHVPKNKERALLDKLSSFKRYLILNIPDQQDKTQPMDRHVNYMSVINYLCRKHRLAYFRHLVISNNESYNFMVFK